MLLRTFTNFQKRLLALDDPPERIAIAFAVGVFFSFSPLYGLHTFLGLTVAFLFGLNRVALLLGLFVINPWTLVPIYAAAIYIGGLFLGFPPVAPFPQFAWKEVFEGRFWVELARHWRLLMPLFLGSTILSFVFAAISYPFALHLMRRYKHKSHSH